MRSDGIGDPGPGASDRVGHGPHGLVLADDPAAEWISNDQAKAAWAEKVAKIKARIAGKQE